MLVAGAVLVGAAFGLRGAAPRQSKAPPFVAAAEGSNRAAKRMVRPSRTLSDAGAIPLKDITQPVPVKVVSSSGSRSSLAITPRSVTRLRRQTLVPTSTDAVRPTAGASSGPPVAVAVKTPAVEARFAARPPAAQQFAEHFQGFAHGLAQPDGSQFATSTPSATDSGELVHARDRRQQPDKNAAKGANGAAGVAQPSIHKLSIFRLCSLQGNLPHALWSPRLKRPRPVLRQKRP